ncbi:MAG: hypothetical protein V1752_03305 [Candidatus Firestonebacteria bacterium]
MGNKWGRHRKSMKNIIKVFLIIYLAIISAFCENTSEIKLEISPESSLYFSGEEMQVNVKVINLTGKEIALLNYFTPIDEYWNYKIEPIEKGNKKNAEKKQII